MRKSGLVPEGKTTYPNQVGFELDRKTGDVLEEVSYSRIDTAVRVPQEMKVDEASGARCVANPAGGL